MTEQKSAYTVSEAAQMLGVGESAIREDIRRGRIVTVPAGRHVRIPKAWLDWKLKGGDARLYTEAEVQQVVREAVQIERARLQSLVAEAIYADGGPRPHKLSLTERRMNNLILTEAMLRGRADQNEAA